MNYYNSFCLFLRNIFSVIIGIWRYSCYLLGTIKEMGANRLVLNNSYILVFGNIAYWLLVVGVFKLFYRLTEMFNLKGINHNS